MVEYLSDELEDSQLQEVMSANDGLVLSFYRFTRQPHSLYIVLDLDPRAPFIGFFTDNPWRKLKKTKPVGLFLASHAKNKKFAGLKLVENLGRVVSLTLGQGSEVCEIEFRIIPKSPNVIVTSAGKTISWSPLKELGAHEPALQKAEDEMRGLPYMMAQWSRMRGVAVKAQAARSESVEASPYEKWKAAQRRAAEKKQKAIASVYAQIEQYESDVWVKVGEHIKLHGLKTCRRSGCPVSILNYRLRRICKGVLRGPRPISRKYRGQKAVSAYLSRRSSGCGMSQKSTFRCI